MSHHRIARLPSTVHPSGADILVVVESICSYIIGIKLYCQIYTTDVTLLSTHGMHDGEVLHELAATPSTDQLTTGNSSRRSVCIHEESQKSDAVQELRLELLEVIQ
jgi:hypothetical protein